mmetsp:Transcript_13803/g.41742  ORF Transcript_13803/g.41742 Transcript_13803/m.41742 type:complete len:119 (+) Transcript_13803:72-428(+)
MSSELCEHGFGPECAACALLWSSEAQREAECVVCRAAPAAARVEPCGHADFCADCLRQLSDCPICRVKITRVSTQSANDTAPPAPATSNTAPRTATTAKRSGEKIDVHAFFRKRTKKG